jgi:SH3 domain-containing YSC84-like protein 1
MRELMGAFLFLAYCSSAVAAAQSKEAERLESSTFVVNEIMQTPDKTIPRELLDRAVCVGVIPSELHFAFFFGGNYGRGALVCRQGGDGSWGAPSMFTLYGGNFGLQFGGKATDIVFIVMNTGGVRKLLQTGVKLGADASAAAGPVGRTAEGATDIQMHAEILSYSRSRGLFAGLSLDGAVLKADHLANRRLYGRTYEPKQILIDGVATPPDAARPLDDILAKYSPRGGEPFPKAASVAASSQGPLND